MTEIERISSIPIHLPFHLRPGIDHPGRSTGTVVLVPGLGLGCDREWMRNALFAESLADLALLSFDFPNQGALAPISATRPLWDGDLDFLTQWVEAICLLATGTGDRFHMVAHSMGNLPAMAAFQSLPEHRRGAFIAIEGNISIEDCFATTRIAGSVEGMEWFIDEMLASDDYALRRWGYDLKQCDPEHLRKLAQGVVAACSTAEPTGDWCFLDEAHYLYGERSGYPEHHRKMFEETGTTVHEIPDSGHFPMYSNPKATWDAVTQAIRSTCA